MSSLTAPPQSPFRQPAVKEAVAAVAAAAPAGGASPPASLNGDGDGGFDPVGDISVGFGPDAVAMADLDADGALDIASINLFYFLCCSLSYSFNSFFFNLALSISIWYYFFSIFRLLIS